MNTRSRLLVSLHLLIIGILTASACQAPTTPAATPGAASTAPAEVPATTVPAAAAPTTAVSAAAAPATAAPATAAPAAATPLYGGTLVIAHAPDMASCNPTLSTEVSYFQNIFDPLIRHNAQLELQPQLATEWEVAPDGRMVTFTLRDDVTWHDGVPFTSADVKFTFEQALAVHHPRGREVFAIIESIETPDARTVIFRLNESRGAFLYQIADSESPIIPSHIYANEDLVEGPHATCEELPIGTGAFRAAAIDRGVSFTMERNDDWWGIGNDYWGGPYLDRIIVAVIQDEAGRVNGLETGEFDYAGWGLVPPVEIERFRAMDGRDVTFECMGVPALRAYGVNLRREPFNDLRVRQAIAYALDLNTINQLVWFGHSIPSPMFLPPTHPEYNPNLQVYQPRDLQRAEALLDEAGYPRGPDGKRFDLRLVYDTRADRNDMAVVFKQLVDETGINVILDSGDVNYWADKVYVQHDFDLAVISLGVHEPSIGVARIFDSQNIGSARFNNASAYANPTMDELWDRYAASFDPATRRETMHEIMELALADLPYIFVNSPTNFAFLNTAEFTGFPTDCIAGYDLLRTVWWKQGRTSP